MTTTRIISKKTRPDFEVEYLGRTIVLKNARALPVKATANLVNDASYSLKYVQLAVTSEDSEFIENNSDLGDVVELFTQWQTFSKDSEETN